MKRVFISTRLSKLNGICPDIRDILVVLKNNAICYWDQDAGQARPLADLPKAVEASLFFIQDSFESELPPSLVSSEPSPDDYYLEHQSRQQSWVRKQFIPLNCKQASHESGSVYEKVTEILLDDNKKDKTDEIIKTIWPSMEVKLEADKDKGLDLLGKYMEKAPVGNCPKVFAWDKKMKKVFSNLQSKTLDSRGKKEYAMALLELAIAFNEAYYNEQNKTIRP